jgi:hypothetical protein
MFQFPLISLLLLLASFEPHSVTMEEFFKHRCDEGDQSACEKLNNLKKSLIIQKRLDERSEKFWQDIDTSLLIQDKKPILHDAYPLVMQDFFRTENEAGVDENLEVEKLPECARHYHNHWINKKLWWPTNEDGTPDWPSIYIYIVDHYYGYCLRKG